MFVFLLLAVEMTLEREFSLLSSAIFGDILDYSHQPKALKDYGCDLAMEICQSDHGFSIMHVMRQITNGLHGASVEDVDVRNCRYVRYVFIG